MRAALLFEAKGIQAFLFAGGRLRDAIGASAAIDALASAESGLKGGSLGLLDAVLAEDVHINQGQKLYAVMRRAAGAFRVVYFGDHAQRRAEHAQRLVRLCLPSVAPGVDFIDAVGVGPTARAAVQDAQDKLLGRRGLSPIVEPPAGPLVLRAPRFGSPATGYIRDKDTTDRARTEPADSALLVKQANANSIGVLRRFGPGKNASDWPFNIDEFFDDYDGPRIVGVIHADGNRLGSVIRALNDRFAKPDQPQESQALLSKAELEYVNDFGAFSEAIERATRSACIEATKAILALCPKSEPEDPTSARKLPLRPLIQAGDDVVVLVRGDLAIPFTARFLEAFAGEAASQLGGLFKGVEAARLPVLTACAGIALVGAGQPFSDAHELAESLCGFAKRAAKATVGPDDPVPSCLAFHRVAASSVRDYGDILERDLATEAGQLTIGPYVCGDPAIGLRRLDDLLKLHALCSGGEAGSGRLRQLATLAYESPAQLDQRYRRWIEVLSRDPDSASKRFVELFCRALQVLTGNPHLSIFEKRPAGGGLPRSPLGDLLALAAIGLTPASMDAEGGPHARHHDATDVSHADA